MLFGKGRMLFRKLTAQKASHSVIRVNIEYEIYAFFRFRIYAYVYNKHGFELIPFPKKEDKHVVSGLWFMKPNKSDFMKLIQFLLGFFS